VVARMMVFGMLVLAAGCGRSTGTRATTGALLGTAGGVALGAATGGIAPVVGAVVGGGAGVASGTVTSQRHQETSSPRGITQPIITRSADGLAVVE
jgi:osmotically inducible lipoprotein OsmB